MSDPSDQDTNESAALREIVEGTAVETGEQFFAALVRHLAGALRTRCAWVTEWLPEARRLRALSFWIDDGYRGDWEYDVANTPCEAVVERREFVHVPDRIIDLYSQDPDLPGLGAVSYMGIPLSDTDGRVPGAPGGAPRRTGAGRTSRPGGLRDLRGERVRAAR